jgi:hypothetical protein
VGSQKTFIAVKEVEVKTCPFAVPRVAYFMTVKPKGKRGL